MTRQYQTHSLLIRPNIHQPKPPLSTFNAITPTHAVKNLAYTLLTHVSQMNNDLMDTTPFANRCHVTYTTLIYHSQTFVHLR